MKRTLTVCISCVLWTTAAMGQLPRASQTTPKAGAQLPAEAVIAKVKAATVFVRVKVGEEPVSCGSGFLVKKTGKIGYIATNEHVIARAVRDKGTIQVVFNSGTTRERTLPATVAAREELRDFALLKVEAPALPIPLNTASPASIKERTFVYIFGFPFGELLSTGNRSPAVTVGLGAISSIRIDESGEPDVIQMEGEIHPGNSGGPVITFDGAVVGLTVAKIQGTRIGFAVPAALLQSAFEGKASSLKLELAEKNQGKVTYRAQVNLVDVLDLIQGVTLLICPTEEVTRKQPQQKNVWSPLSTRMQDFPLVVKDHVAEGQIPLTGKPGAAATYCVQLKLTRRDRRVIYTSPSDVKVEFPSEVIMGEIKESAARGPVAAGKASTGSDWLGSTGDQKSVAAANAGTSAQTNESLVLSTSQVLDAKVTVLKPTAEHYQERPCFSPDGMFLFLLENGGTLRKIRVKDWTEERRFLIEQRWKQFGLSKAGPVVLLPAKPNAGPLEPLQVWLFDAETLQVAKRFAVMHAGALTASPMLDEVFVTVGRDLLAINVRTGVLTTLRMEELYQEQASRIKNPSKGSRAFGFGNTLLTPDGKHLIEVGHSLSRFRVQGPKLTYEEISPPISTSSQVRPMISQDSRHLFVDLSDDKKVRGSGPYLFNVEDLQAPPFGLSCGYGADGDPVTHVFYAPSSEGVFVISPEGVRTKLYPAQSGSYRLCIPHPAGNKVLVLGKVTKYLELGASDAAQQRSTAALPPGGNLRGPNKNSGAVEVVTVKLPTEQLLPTMQWSGDGKWLYALEKGGVLHKVETSTLTETARSSLGGPCTCLGVSGDGILAVREDLQELWQLDEATLQVKQAIHVPGARDVASCPKLHVAYVTGGSQLWYLTAVDLKTGSIRNQFCAYDYNKGRNPPRSGEHSGGLSFENGAVTPDGNYILFYPRDKLHLFRIDGYDVSYEDVGPRIGGPGSSTVHISPDSKYVVAPGNSSIESSPLPEGRYSYVFSVTNLRHPIATLQGRVHFAAFDPAAGKVYTLASSSPEWAIDVLRPEGSIESTYPLSVSRPQQLLVHPAGRKLALLTEKELLWITLPGAEKPGVSPDSK